ncbi:MAG: hypothetical protein ACI4ED_05205 [Suilimivivens sp.]
MKRKMITLGAVMLLGMSLKMTAYAQPAAMPDGTVFDAEFYAETYPDVKEAFGNDETALYNHYLQYGKSEGRLACAAADNAKTVQEPQTSGVKLEPEDKNYLNAACVANGLDFDESKWWSPTYSFVRKDYSSNPRYQQLKAWIIDTIEQSGNAKNLEVSAPYNYYVATSEESIDLVNMTKNLAVDLMKEGYCNNITIANLPADGAICAYTYGREWYQLCNINMTCANKNIVAKHPELKGYLKQ